MTVRRTLALKISPAGEVRMSFDKTTKSANLPTYSEDGQLGQGGWQVWWVGSYDP